MTDDSMTEDDELKFRYQVEERKQDRQRAVWLVGMMAVASGAVSMLYHGLRWGGFGHSAAMFVGIPGLLAVLLAMTPKSKSITGGIVKGITLMLLIVAPLLGEGMICIAMAAPIFFAVGVPIGLLVEWYRRRKGTTMTCVALVLVPMCLEGVVPEMTFDRHQVVEVTEVVSASEAEVEAALNGSPRLGVTLPAFLRIGFPVPLAAQGEGLELGALRTVRFAASEGAPGGDLVMRVVDSRQGYVRLERVKDESKIGQWMTWDWNDLEWEAIDAGHTRVRERIGFERKLDPAWYFTPLERAAVHEAARYLIAANATPGAR